MRLGDKVIATGDVVCETSAGQSITIKPGEIFLILEHFKIMTMYRLQQDAGANSHDAIVTEYDLQTCFRVYARYDLATMQYTVVGSGAGPTMAKPEFDSGTTPVGSAPRSAVTCGCGQVLSPETDILPSTGKLGCWKCGWKS